MVAWDGESDLGGIRFRRSSIPLLLGAVAVTAGWTAVWAVSDHPAQLPATGVDRRDATYGPLALPWQGAATAGQWRSMGPAPIGGEICCGSSLRGEYGSASGRITSLVTEVSTQGPEARHLCQEILASVAAYVRRLPGDGAARGWTR